MAELIQFVSNYDDNSTDNGFQFEFRCDRCHSGYRTKFRSWAVGTMTNVAEAAASLFGGVFGQAANIGGRVKSAQWEKAHDDAFMSSVEEIKPEFMQCPRCQGWVCKAQCWNTKKGLCKNCAPDLGVEMAAAQASRSVQEVWAHAQMAEEDKKLTEADWREGIRATCPKCNVPLATNAKFCPDCGAKIKEKIFCVECGVALQPGTKFCNDCGAKQPEPTS